MTTAAVSVSREFAFVGPVGRARSLWSTMKTLSSGLAAAAIGAVIVLVLAATASAQGNPFMAADLVPASTTSGASFTIPDIFPGLTNANTVEAWVNLGEQSSGIVQFGDTTASNAILLYTNYAGGQHTLRFTGVAFSGSTTGSGGTFAPNTWTHIAAVFSTGSTATVYVNGTASNVTWGGSAGFGYQGNVLGQVNNAGTVLTADGSISGLRAWDTARSTVQIGGFTNITDTLAGQPGLLYNYVVGSTGYGPLTQGLAGTTPNLTKNASSVSNLIYTKYGAANLTAQASTTYDSSLAVAQGTLTLGANNQMLDGGTLGVSGGGVLDMGGFSDTVGAVTLTNGTITNGTLTGSSYAALEGTFSAVLAGASSTLTKTSGATVRLTAANTYGGLTDVQAGELRVETNGALGTTATGTQVASGATLDFRNVNYATAEAITLNGGQLRTSSGSSVVAGAITLAADSAVNVDAGADLTLSGNMSGSGGLAKDGDGVLTISGASVGYSGLTSVNDGDLVLNATVPGNVTVASGAALFGSMQVGGTTTIASGGILSVGDIDATGGGTFDTLNLNGFTIVGFAANPDPTAPQTDYDQMLVNTSLTYGGDLYLAFDGLVANSETDTFAVFGGAATPTGNFSSVEIFAGDTPIGQLTFAGGRWSGVVDLGFGGGDQVFTFNPSAGTLQVVPEPSSFALAGMALAGLAAAGYTRRRRAAIASAAATAV